MLTTNPAEAAAKVRAALPPGGLFAQMDWRIAPEPFHLEERLGRELETLGRVLLQFNRSVNLLYRQSVVGKQPSWVAEWLDLGKTAELVDLQRDPAFKNEVPRVIRPDLLLTDAGFSVTELDSVPGGIGLTAWLNQTYAGLLPTELPAGSPAEARLPRILGGADGMLRGFEGIFGDAKNVHLVVSEESATYRPEMEWLAQHFAPGRFQVRDASFTDFQPGDAVYRFFELFDLPNLPAGGRILEMAREKQIRLTPPPKPIFEEKMLFALLWNRHLRGFWRQELGEAFFQRMLRLTPYTWLVNPEPLPPHAALPEINLTDWRELKALSQKERNLILKVSGFSENAWGARGVYLGSDLSGEDWSAAVDLAISSYAKNPHVLQRYEKPATVESRWFDFGKNAVQPMAARVRLCPYYFVHGDGDAARPHLGGVLATICPADKKIIHGMTDAILAPCST